MDPKSWLNFVDAVAMRESSGDYMAKNQWGFLGRYQFGMARLCDLGLTERIPGKKGFSNDSFRWLPKFSEFIFLRDHKLQDACFEVHIGLLAGWVRIRYSAHLREATLIQGFPFTLSGAIMVCHLLGKGGLAELVAGHNSTDALGTPAIEYFARFEGYEIPKTLISAYDFHARFLNSIPPIA